MNNNAWFKKENPFQTVIGYGGGATGFGAYSSSAAKTYIDDVFSTYAYIGNQTARSITNNINLTKGGMVWTKRRSGTGNNTIYDTVRGATYYVRTNLTNAQGNDANTLSSFNSDGFSLGSDTTSNDSGTFGSWSFRESPGFFDVVQYTGNGATQTINHSLKSIPGCIMIKNLSNTTNWVVYHRFGGVPQAVGGNYSYFTRLNTTGAEYNSTNQITSTPTASSFTLGDNSDVNQNSDNYIAYIFAGGESTAATAKSVDFGSSAELTIPDNAAWELGTTFTIEAWIRPDNFDNSYNTIVSQSDGSDNWYFSVLGGGSDNGKMQFWDFTSPGSGTTTTIQNEVQTKVWTHVAFVANSGSGQWYINGKASGTATSGVNVTSGSGGLKIAEQNNHGYEFDGKISNLRIVKGTAVYTSSFKPPTEPLTNITNTVLLCCNNSSVTGSTVTPDTITAVNSPSASDRNPFDDPEGFKFGENEDQNIIKTGEYLGRSSTLNPVVDLGWEPQFIMIKALTTTGPWLMYDCIRGVITGSDSPYLQSNSVNQETTNTSYIELTSTGFKINGNYSDVNSDFATYAYIAIRRPDGYVGKPPEAGTDVFAMDTGNASATIPAFDSGFPVDYIFQKEPASSSDNWYTGSRLTGSTNGSLNLQSAFGNWTDMVWDSNVGVTKNMTSSTQGWMFKRGQGFDVVAYTGNGTAGHQIRHSLSKSPEMIWVKDRENTRDWRVFHHGLNGGSNPAQYGIKINSYDVESQNSSYWNDTAPTSTSFTIGTSNNTNNSSTDYIAMLFASVDSISKVGYYSGSSSQQTISTGFQPRFVIIRRVNDQQDWVVLDTLRGWVQSTNDPRLELNYSTAQNANTDFGYPTTGGFVLEGNLTKSNESGGEYIYYAHA